MSGAEGIAVKKQAYFAKLIHLLDTYTKAFVVVADNVGSNHMQRIRSSLRGKATLLMGKNTMIRKAIRGHVHQNPAIESLLPYVKGNIGFIFTDEDLGEVKKIITDNKVGAPAKAGTIAPCDVTIPSGPTGMEPTQTALLQALNIPTKIVKGQIEIINEVQIINKGSKVGASEANILAKLNIKPFEFGLVVKTVYDNGTTYDATVLDMTDEDIVNRFRNGVSKVAAMSLQLGLPTMASLPHSVVKGYKNILAVSLATDYTIPATDEFKKFLENPGAFAPQATTAAPAAEKAAPVEEAKEESDEDFGAGGLFGDD